MSYAAWVSSTDRALTLAAGQVKLIRAVTPINAESELALLEQAFRRGQRRLPRWQYDPPLVPSDLRRALEALAAFLDNEPPLGPIYAARARELCLEAAIIDATGTPRLRALARERFLGTSPEGRDDEKKADELALAWTSRCVEEKASLPGGVDRCAEVRVRSCDAADPRSLLSRMASEVGRKRLPVRVFVQPGLASLAATGDGVILIAPGRWLTRRDVARTVLHEIAGHALPRARAARAPLAIFAVGTARGIDDQEGRAIAIEDAAGYLDSARKHELGFRHLAARATLDGADFADIVELLQRRQATVESALRIAARVQRGCHGAGGLAREIVYLPARYKLERVLAEPEGREIEAMMRGGRIAADVALNLAAALTKERCGSDGRTRLKQSNKGAVSNETR